MEDHNSKDNRKLRRILRLRWIWIIVGCGVLAALILMFLPFGMDYGIERYFLTHGADEADVADVDFNLFTRRLVLKNVTVKAANEQVLNVSEADFTIAWSPFFKKRFLIEKIDLSDSLIIIEEMPEGRWRIGGLSLAPSADRSAASPWGFGLVELQVQNSQVKFRSSPLTSELQIEQARLTRLRSWLPDQDAHLTFEGKLNDGTLQFQGDLSPVGSGTIVDGALKLQGLTLTPFAQLIAADPSTLQGRLDADVRILSKYSSEKEFNFDQTGRLALNRARMRFGDVDLADEHFTWEGTVQIKLPAASGALLIAAAGQLEGQGGSVNPAPENFNLQHRGLNWNGKFALTRKPETSELNVDGALKLQNFKMAASDVNLAEESLTWDGGVQIEIPTSPDALLIAASGQLEGQGGSVNPAPENFNLQHRGLNWNGKFALTRKPETSELNVDGALKLQNFKMAASDVNLAEESLTWDGGVQIEMPTSPDALLIAASGQLEGQGGSVNPAPENFNLQHRGLNWNGKFALTRKPETSELNVDGALKLQNFKMAASDVNLAEESLTWDGGVQIEMPTSPDALLVAASGQLEGQESSLNSTSENFAIQHSGLNWNGKFTFATKQETADTGLEGELKLGKLEVGTSDLSLTEENLTWNGSLEIFLPENGETQRLTTNGKLESKHQTIAFLRENLNLANENLLWKGQFNCGLQDFNAGFAAEGDFSLTDLAITATQKRLRLLASKAVSLKSIKGDAGSQFSVATAKITGLDLIGETDSPENAALFSASEVTVDNVKLERLKQVSIESTRIVDAKGVLHHKNDGRWLYIDDLTTFLADSGSSSQRKPSQNRVAEENQSPAKEEDVEFGIRIGSLEIAGDSRLHFEDETVSPTFSTDVSLKEARLTGVNSFQPEQSSPFTLEASSRKYTRLKLQGNIQPFGERISMDLKGKIKAAEMPPLSPYAVKTLGYNLISGEMDADIDLKIIMGKMEGEGDLKFYSPKIEAVDPEKFKNEGGKPIPLPSALEVLRDKDNDVRLMIPISGDVTDPKFSFSDAINQALIKGLTLATLSYLKYMLGPYGMAIGIIELGVKVGAKALPGIRLKPVEFQPGASDLDPATKEYLDKVASIMKEKKDVVLRLCGWATESDRMGPREAAEIPTSPPGAAPLEKKSAPDGEIDAPKDTRFPIGDEAMLALAERRADLMEDILVNQHGIKDKRIFICKPEIDKNPDAKPRVELVF